MLAVTGQAGPADIASLRSVAPAANAGFLAYAGAAALILDQTGRAIELLESARQAAGVTGNQAVAGDPLAALGWAYADAGRRHWKWLAYGRRYPPCPGQRRFVDHALESRNVRCTPIAHRRA